MFIKFRILTVKCVASCSAKNNFTRLRYQHFVRIVLKKITILRENNVCWF